MSCGTLTSNDYLSLTQKMPKLENLCYGVSILTFVHVIY
jgi:hypothetical protein